MAIRLGYPDMTRKTGTKKCKMAGACDADSLGRESVLSEQPAQLNHVLTSGPRKGEPTWERHVAISYDSSVGYAVSKADQE